MARYGSGGEDFSQEEAALRALRAQREGMIDAERRHQAELAKTTGLEDEVARKEETRKRAKVESREVSRREAQAGAQATRQVKLDTEAIERNTEARRRNAAVAQRQNINVSRAFSGARDPMFAPAFGIRGAETTQYAMRQQLEGVGSRRARAMQEAIQLGIRPSAGYEAEAGPRTRAQAALSAKAAADLDAAQATREYANITKRAGSTAEQVESALVAKEAARSRAKAADTELESARSTEAASRANVTAIQREQKGHEQVARVKVDEARQVQQTMAVAPASRAAGMADVTTRRPPLQIPMTTTVMPISPMAMGRIVPRGDIREAGAGGIVGSAQGQAAEAARTQAAATAEATQAQRAHNEEMARSLAMSGQAREAAAIYANELGNAGRAASLLQQADLDDAMDRNAKAVKNLGQATRDAGADFYPLNQTMHRHGALTTEFIAAAARGETTVRELGNQALLTAGKFAGWTLAASAIYGVAGALKSVGEGAINAQSGTEQAFRVITENKDADALKGSFAGLAREFNVPIDVAADSVYRMGQVFHDQETAVTAARAALYSYKTGEVDVATSTRNLIAVVNGFGLTGDELVNVYDQINQAQNRFGIGIGDTEAGLAKAAGVYKNAGGDLDYLLGLFVAIQKATGRSGTEIGTGIARAVNRIREPISIEKLTAQGVEVDPENFQKTLQNALKRAATSTNVDVQQLATGLFGNQYARLIAPVLADQDLLNKALGETSPEKSKGSAQKELAKVLNQVDEQIQKIGTSLQVLGVELERAGAFNFIFLALKGFTELLEVTTRVLDIFNKLPAPLREGVVMIGQMAIALGALRKFGATERLAGGPLSFLAAPEARQRKHIEAGLRQSRQVAVDRTERLGGRAVDAAMERDLALSATSEYRQSQEYIDLRAGRITDEKEVARIQQQGLALEASSQRAHREYEAATRQATSARKISRRVEQDFTAVQAAATPREAIAVAQARGVRMPVSIDQPNLLGTVAAGGRSDPYGRLAATAGPAVEQSARQVRQARRAAQSTSAVIDNMRWSLMSLTGGRQLGHSYALLERGAQRSVSLLQTGGNFALRAGRDLKRIPGQVGGFVRGLGALDAALIGFVAFQAIDSVVDRLGKDLDDSQKFLDKYKGNTLKSQAQLRERARKAQQDAGTTWGDRLQRVNDLLNPVELVGSTLPEIYAGTYEDPEDRRANQAAAYLQQEVLQKGIKRMQDAQRGAGMPRMMLTADELIGDIDRDQDLLRQGLISRAEFARRMDLHTKELDQLIEGTTKAQQSRARLKVAGAARGVGGDTYAATLADMGLDELSAELNANFALAQSTGEVGPQLRRAAQAYAEIVNDLAGKTDAESILALQQARDQFYQLTQQTVQSELDAALRGAGSEAERRAAFERAADRLRGVTRKPRRQLREAQSNVTGAERRRDFLRERLEEGLPEARLNILTGEPELRTLPTDARAKLQKDLDKAVKDVANYKEDRKRFRKELNEAKKKQRELEDELSQASYGDRQQGRELRLQLRISQTASGSEQAALQVKFARIQLKDAADTFGKGSREYRQALIELNNARQQAAQQILRDIDAENSLMIALAGNDPGAQARARTQAEMNKLNAMLRQPGRFDPNDIKEQRARVIESENARREQAKQEAQQIASLQAQIAQARSGDPVAAARIGVRAAKAALRQAGTRVEKLQALLDLINANNELRDALLEKEQARTDLLISRTEDPVKIAHLETLQARRAIKGTKGVNRMKAIAEYNRAKTNERNTKIDARQDDINFLLEMDKITREEAAKRLEELAKIKGISKAKKRELLLAAKRLRDEAEGEYDIDIGNLKLPTLYEVRRFVQAGLPSGAGVGAQVYNNQSINISVRDQSDMDEVSRTLEANLTGENRSTARNMRMR